MKTSNTLLISFVVVAALSLLSCGKKDAAPQAAATDSTANAVFDWKKMTHDQKKDYMKNVVMHKMRPLFHDFDPERFEKINCKTCHQEDGVEQDSFKMPNPDILKLPATPAGWNKLKNGKDSSMLKFMAEVVKPKMAELLHLTPYDMKTNTGEFGCNNCHMTEGK
jgi:cytochrome c